MSSSISPYALLCASKPKHAPTVVTAYDLYSTAQSSSAPAPDSAASDVNLNVSVRNTSTQHSAQTCAAPSVSLPAKRTHYIAEIQSRHNAARRSSLSMRP